MPSLPIVRIQNIEMVSVSKMVPHPRNPNKHSDAQIKRLADIIEFQGWRYPVKISKQSGFVTSGHGRILAAQLRGWETVPVSYQDYDSEAQEYADVVADNAIAEWSEMDDDKIKTDLSDFPELDDALLGLDDLIPDPDKDENHPLEGVEQKNIFEVVVTCQNESEQEMIYNRLTGEGLSCRVLSM